MLKEFKEFALKGNVVDMAIGIIIGAAFSTIVRSLVDDIVMPPLGVITGGVDFSNMFISLNGEHYGSLVQARQAGPYHQFWVVQLSDCGLRPVHGGQRHEPAEAQAGGRARHRAATFTRGGAASGDQACGRQRLRWRHWTGRSGENRTVD